MTNSEPRVIVVTGASRGLGREIALRFGAAGERVAVHYQVREEAALEVVQAIERSGGEAFSVQADLKSSEQAGRAVRSAAHKWGKIDVVVNNAGSAQDGLVLRMNEQAWDDVVRTNLSGPFYCMRAAADIMTTARSGHIINIASIVGIQGREGQANYAASKAGLLGLTRAAALEFGAYNIQVNAVLPGYLMTDLGATVSQDQRRKIMAEHVLNRPGDAGEAAEFIYRLTLLKNVSGQVFNLDSRIL